jgi:hypothetical protein
VNKSVIGHENEPYEETPISAYELPDASDLHRDIPTKGIYVIPYDRPDTILVQTLETYSGDEVIKRCQTDWDGSPIPLGKRQASIRRIYHTALTGALPVIAAGEYLLLDKTKKEIRINNASGHYMPSNNTLEYAACLFTKKGYTVTVKKHTTSRNENMDFFKESKPLSYWMETPRENWYKVAAAAVKGGKRKTRKGKTSKQKTRRAMRRKNI